MMDYDIVNRFLSRKGKIRLCELKNAVLELKNNARKNRENEINDYYSFYDGQVNAYLICLDLIENFEKRLENK